MNWRCRERVVWAEERLRGFHARHRVDKVDKGAHKLWHKGAHKVSLGRVGRLMGNLAQVGGWLARFAIFCQKEQTRRISAASSIKKMEAKSVTSSQRLV